MRIMCGVLCRQVSSKKYNMSFNNSSGTSYLLNPPQYSMITNTSRSLNSFLCSSEFILHRYSSKSSSILCSISPDKTIFSSRSFPFRFLFLLMNLSNDVPLVGLVFYNHISVCSGQSSWPKSQDYSTPNIHICCRLCINAVVIPAKSSIGNLPNWVRGLKNNPYNASILILLNCPLFPPNVLGYIPHHVSRFSLFIIINSPSSLGIRFFPQCSLCGTVQNWNLSPLGGLCLFLLRFFFTLLPRFHQNFLRLPLPDFPLW